MKSKILFSLLFVSAAAFSSILFMSKDEIPAFNLANAKILTPSHASDFDYSNIKNVTEKKQIFFDTLRPIIENQNQIIRDNRQHALFARDHDIDIDWLTDIANKYNIEWDNSSPQWDSLLNRMDTIPVELVMSQAANESAWGTSRFAKKGNNLFGQWCFKKGCGIVPGQRDAGTKHEVKKFDSINSSVASYMHNINTTRAYKSLRSIRSELRSQNKPVDAMVLATGLEKYSSRGQAYVKEIQSMIKTNLPLMQGLNQTYVAKQEQE